MCWQGTWPGKDNPISDEERQRREAEVAKWLAECNAGLPRINEEARRIMDLLEKAGGTSTDKFGNRVISDWPLYFKMGKEGKFDHIMDDYAG